MGDRMKMRKTLKAKMADELNPRQGPEFKYAEQRASLSGKKAEASMATQYIALSKGADIQEKREAAQAAAASGGPREMYDLGDLPDINEEAMLEVLEARYKVDRLLGCI